MGDIRVGEDRDIFEDFRHVHPNVIVTGFVPPHDLPAYVSTLDVVVQPSLRDGLPNALLEAMACGKTVIGTSVGGIQDAVTDCVDGRLVPANDSEALANTISALLMDEAQRQRLGMAACQTIHTRFTLQGELDEKLAVYRRLGLPL